jgi:hypothetical protein
MAFIQNIPPQLITSGQNAIRAAAQIRGTATWQPMAQATNWVLGRGGSLVVAGPPWQTTITAGGSRAFHFYHWPRKQNQFQIWYVSIQTTTQAGASGTVEVPNGTELGTWQIDSNVDAYQPQTFAFQRTVASPDGTPADITVTVRNDSDSDAAIIVTSISGHELPRYDLDTFTASPVIDDQTCATKAPIFEESSDEQSVNAVAVCADNAVTEGRRSCLFSWFYPSGVTITAGSFPGTSNIFMLDPSIVARHLYSGTNTATVNVAVYAAMTGSTPAGDVKVTAASGASSTLHFTSASSTWVTGNLTVETEDLSRLSTDGGLRGGTRETLRIEARKTAGTAIVVAGICIGEA